MNNQVCDLFKIRVPIIQAGMVWCSGWRLASAVSNAGGLGLIGAGSMYPDVLRQHIAKCQNATDKPFGVNVPLLYPQIEDVIKVIVDRGVKIVFTSAGNPATWSGLLKDKGITVVHVVSSLKFALKAQQAGVDAVVAEGFEAGGHNGREETTTLVLLPLIRHQIKIPLIAAGGIATGRAMLAAEVLGADGVQVGSRFATSVESSAHDNFKKRVIDAGEGDTVLTMKQLTPVRLIKNLFYETMIQAEQRGATRAELEDILGKRRARRGIFEGDMDEGELEIGQVSAMLNKIETAADIVNDIYTEYNETKKLICDGVFKN